MTNAVAEIKFLNIPVLKIRDYRNRFYETWIVNFCTRRFYKIPDFIKSASHILTFHFSHLNSFIGCPVCTTIPYLGGTPIVSKGRWSAEEKSLFERAIVLVWGNWAEIAREIPSRSNKQVKSHAYKIWENMSNTRLREMGVCNQGASASTIAPMSCSSKTGTTSTREPSMWGHLTQDTTGQKVISYRGYASDNASKRDADNIYGGGFLKAIGSSGTTVRVSMSNQSAEISNMRNIPHICQLMCHRDDSTSPQDKHNNESDARYLSNP